MSAMYILLQIMNYIHYSVSYETRLKFLNSYSQLLYLVYKGGYTVLYNEISYFSTSGYYAGNWCATNPASPRTTSREARNPRHQEPLVY